MHYPNLDLLIGGRDYATADKRPVINPANGETIGAYSVASPKELDAAIDCAREGFREWRTVHPDRRAEILAGAASLIRQRVDEIAPILTLEQGKTLAEARAEILRACDIIDWDAQEGRRIYGRVIPSAPGMRYAVYRQPIGIVAAFSPWNFPFGSPTRKFSAALAAGCAIIAKPSEETPASGLLLAKAFIDAGIPHAAISVVFGNPPEIAHHLISAPDVRMIGFTGSVPVGKAIATKAAEYLKPAILELGGHSPAIICGDVDASKVAKAAANVKSRCSGQVCTSPTRFMVERSLFPEFCEEFAAHARRIRIGDGFDPEVEMGPVVNERRVEMLEQVSADAAAHGAEILHGGSRVGDKGSFFPLTVVANAPDNALAMRDEPFGPIALLSAFDDIDEAIERANALPYGLAAYAFTNSASVRHRLIDTIECGNFSINHFGGSVPQTPLGGVKNSGYGREGGTEGLTHYTVAKAVTEQY